MSPEIVKSVREHIARRWLARRYPGAGRTHLLSHDDMGFRFIISAGLPRWTAWASLPVAMFDHMQPYPGRESIAMYTLTRDIPGHPMGSTVSEATLMAAEIRL